jgi:hypothetical protein
MQIQQRRKKQTQKKTCVDSARKKWGKSWFCRKQNIEIRNNYYCVSFWNIYDEKESMTHYNTLTQMGIKPKKNDGNEKLMMMKMTVCRFLL